MTVTNRGTRWLTNQMRILPLSEVVNLRHFIESPARGETMNSKRISRKARADSRIQKEQYFLGVKPTQRLYQLLVRRTMVRFSLGHTRLPAHWRCVLGFIY